MEFYALEQLSENRVRLSDGSILIRNTPIARTGVQLYGANETAIKGEHPRDTVYIERDADEVFAPNTIASVNGKSLVDDHPDEDVMPRNWRELTHGIVFNPRRGTGLDDDLLLADIIVTTPEGIALINDGKTELSCGYDAQYEKLGPNKGRQYNIIINHIALVDSGRCGTRCSVKDKAMPKKMNAYQRVLDAFGVKDAEELKEKLEKTEDEGGAEGEAEGTHIHMHMPEMGGTSDSAPQYFKDYAKKTDDAIATIRDAVTKVTDAFMKAADAEGEGEETEEEKKKKEAAERAEVEKEAEEEVGDKAKDVAKAKDSALLVESFTDVVSIAEIIVPGISVPTFDAKASPKATMSTMCGFRRKVLDAAYADADTKAIMDELLTGRTYDSKMSCGSVRTLFRSTGAVKRRINNAGGNKTVDVEFGHAQPVGKLRSPADLNKYYAGVYK